MAHQVPWTKAVLNMFIEYAMLSEEEIFIMENRVRSKPISWMASEMGLSESSVNRMVSKLKKKYDKVQAEHPDEMPKRRFSAKETWMDTH